MGRERIAKMTFSMLKHRRHHCRSAEMTEPERSKTSACPGARAAGSAHMPACEICITFLNTRCTCQPRRVCWRLTLKIGQLPALPLCHDYFNGICYSQPIKLELKDFLERPFNLGSKTCAKLGKESYRPNNQCMLI